jgi:hypothetical protein
MLTQTLGEGMIKDCSIGHRFDFVRQKMVQSRSLFKLPQAQEMLHVHRIRNLLSSRLV